MLCELRMKPLDVAAHFHVSTSTIRNWAGYYGIPRLRKRQRKIDIPVDDLRKAYIDDGVDLNELAKRYGVSRSTVQGRLLQSGIALTREQVSKRAQARNAIKYPQRTRSRDGYWKVINRDHPDCGTDGYVGEHRMLMELMVGRELRPGEVVHHINMDKGDNSLGNLALFASMRDHLRIHRYTERIGAYMIGRLAKKPEPLHFENAVFFEGKWVYEIDLIGSRSPSLGDGLEAQIGLDGQSQARYLN